MTIKPYGLGFRGSCRDLFVYNYISVGVDAQVTLNFHRTRESPFYLFSHRMFNKVALPTLSKFVSRAMNRNGVICAFVRQQLLYLGFGTQQVVEREYKDLDRSLEVYLDGKKVQLPSIESVVILNIPSWAAGVDLWKMATEGY